MLFNIKKCIKVTIKGDSSLILKNVW